MFSKLFNKNTNSEENEIIIKFLNSGVLYFDLINPTFDKSAGFVYQKDKETLFLPVINKYLKNKDLDNFTVRMGITDDIYLLVDGTLKSATSQEDIEFVFNELLKDWRWDKEKAQYSLYDKRNGKPRKYRYKLKIKNIVIQKTDKK